MSDILQIYASVAAAPVILNGTTVTAYTPDKLPNVADTAILPCRLLLPVSSTGRGSGSGSFLGDFGTLAQISWSLQDICLLAPVAQGTGLAQYAPQIIAYMAAYHEMIRTIRVIPNIANLASSIATWNLVPHVLEWPQGGGTTYFAVSATLTIEEST